MGEPGILYIVATPIGNLDDISQRALKILQDVDVVAAEDTRHSKKLLQAYQISTPMISLHEHNESSRTQGLLDRLSNGQQVALISDAGTPLISDPGYVLVNEARAQGHRVVPIPGACAAIAALCAAGLPTDRFLFIGFLPGPGPIATPPAFWRWTPRSRNRRAGWRRAGWACPVNRRSR